jgi:hypothetical protein
MKGRITCLLASCLFILFLILTACTSPASEEPEPTLTEAEKPQLEQMEKELAERGVLNVSTLEEAAEIAGFPLATPAFIPEGFRRNSQIMISQLGAGLPEGMGGSRPKYIDIMWMWEEDSSVWFMLTQGEKEFQVSPSTDRFSLGWNDGNLYYGLSGTLAGPLNEDVLNQIAGSVGTD